MRRHCVTLTGAAFVAGALVGALFGFGAGFAYGSRTGVYG